MKKILIFTAALLVCGALYSQQEKPKPEPKQFLAFHAGPSVPVGDFGKATLTNSSGIFEDREAGFAQTGFTAGITYQYQLQKNFGLAATAFYNNNKLNSNRFVDEINKMLAETGLTISGIKLDHWQWYGITAGPVLNQAITEKLMADVTIMGGVANVNSPKATVEGVMLVDEDWSVAPVVGANGSLRLNVSSNMFVMLNASYQYMRPKFTMTYNPELTSGVTTSENSQQKIEVLNVSAGIGFRF